MSGIDDMFTKFKDYAELKEFAEAQHKTLTKLSKKAEDLEKENSHLKKLLESTVPVLNVDGDKLSINMTNEESICVKQIEDLKKISDERALTYEEVKKSEILIKVLKMLRASVPDETNKELQTKNVAELLTLVKNEQA